MAVSVNSGAATVVFASELHQDSVETKDLSGVVPSFQLVESLLSPLIHPAGRTITRPAGRRDTRSALLTEFRHDG